MNRDPHCPNCNVLMTRESDIEIPLGPLVVPAALYVCPNPDDLCGHFTIFGEKMTVSADAEFEEVE